MLGGVGDGGGPSTVIARMHRWSLLSTRFLRRSGPRLRGAKGQYARVHLAVMIFLCVTSRWCYAQMRSSDFLLLPLGCIPPCVIMPHALHTPNRPHPAHQSRTTPSAPALAKTGNSGWLATAQTPSSARFRCPNKSWRDVFRERSHNLRVQSVDAVKTASGESGDMESDVSGEGCARMVCVGWDEAMARQSGIRDFRRKRTGLCVVKSKVTVLVG